MSENQNIEMLVKQALASLDDKSKRQMIDTLRGVLHEELFQLSTTVTDYPCCPHCGSVSIVKKGKALDGSQRYLWKDCERTFSQSTNRPLSLSKLDGSVWMQYAECFVYQLSLRECAAICHASVYTAFRMRHRIMRCLESHLPQFRGGNGIGMEIDETYFAESFRGSHKKDGFIMPRPAHKRGHSIHVRGLSAEQICVASGINDCEDSSFVLAGRGSLSGKRALDALDGIVNAGSKVRTDKSKAYLTALPALGIAVHERVDSKDRSTGVVSKVNSLHSSLGHFMSRFKGVATKHLHSYLAWFSRVGYMSAMGATLSERAIEVASDDFDRNRLKDYFYQPSPHMDYWERKAA